MGKCHSIFCKTSIADAVKVWDELELKRIEYENNNHNKQSGVTSRYIARTNTINEKYSTDAVNDEYHSDNTTAGTTDLLEKYKLMNKTKSNTITPNKYTCDVLHRPAIQITPMKIVTHENTTTSNDIESNDTDIECNSNNNNVQQSNNDKLNVPLPGQLYNNTDDEFDM